MKNGIVAILFLASVAVCFAQDNYYANRDVRLYRTLSGRDLVRVVEIGESLFILEDGIGFGPWGARWTRVQAEDGSVGWLAVDAISVVDSEKLPVEITGSTWTHGYYLDVLRSGNREILFEHESFWRDGFYRYRHSGLRPFQEERLWYENAGLGMSPFTFHTIFTRIGDLADHNFYDLIHGRITQEDGVFSFSFNCARKRITFEETDLERFFQLNEKGIMALGLDGDFLDVAVNDTEMFTLVRRSEEMIDQFQKLMMGDSVDLSRIVWPRRADGTMDFPPPGVDMVDFEASHTTTARLRVRDTPDTDSLIATTLDAGAEVQVLETGSVVTIGDVTAPWVRVLTASGFTGWAFSGFLEPIAVVAESGVADLPEAIVNAVEIPEEQPESIHAASPQPPVNGTGTNPLPPWGLAVIIGGALATLSGVALFVVRRKRA